MQGIRVPFRGSIDEATAQALHRIDVAAGDSRRRYITTAPGQSETYQEKYQAALAYQDNPMNTSPWLESEADATGLSVSTVAQMIIDQRDQWVTVGAAIEGVRIGAKAAIRAAGTAREAFAIAKEACAKLDLL